MKRILLTLTLLTNSAFASGYYPAGNGYYKNGAGQLFFRQTKQVLYNGCWRQEYTYTPVVIEQRVEAVISPDQPDWKQRVLDLHAKQIEYNAFIESLNTLPTSKFTNHQNFAYSAQQFVNPGYTYGNSVLPVINPIQDLERPLIMLQEYAKTSQRLNHEVGTNLFGVTGQVVSSNQLLVKAQAVQMLLEALKEESVTTINAQPTEDSVSDKRVSKGVYNKCVACHNSDKSSGGLDLTADLTDEQRLEIALRIRSSDSTVQMPPPTSEQLTFEEKVNIMTSLKLKGE